MTRASLTWSWWGVRFWRLRGRVSARGAHSLGLYLPGYGPSMNPPFALVWLPGMSYHDDGIPMWDAVPDKD